MNAAANLGWMALGACRSTDPELHFPEGDESSKATRRQVAKAKRVCAGCPVLSDCARYAVDEDIRFGVWGGLSEGERAAVRQALLLRAVQPREAVA